ncbi:MAG: hypothetical protein NTW52_10720 [Planctomycetota bacterium]|nr:hypothetical protein [Planctomycetota bacterium]
MAKEVNVLALVKGDEQYLFLFDDSNRVETLRLLGRYAADPDLSFSWYDAAVLSQKIRSTMPASSISSSPAESSFESTSSDASQQSKNSPLASESNAGGKQVRFQFPSFKQERLPE